MHCHACIAIVSPCPNSTAAVTVLIYMLGVTTHVYICMHVHANTIKRARSTAMRSRMHVFTSCASCGHDGSIPRTCSHNLHRACVYETARTCISAAPSSMPSHMSHGMLACARMHTNMSHAATRRTPSRVRTLTCSTRRRVVGMTRRRQTGLDTTMTRGKTSD